MYFPRDRWSTLVPIFLQGDWIWKLSQKNQEKFNKWVVTLLKYKFLDKFVNRSSQLSYRLEKIFVSLNNL